MENGADTFERHILLVVDDDMEWTDLLRIFFAPKYQVHVANHADAAIDFMRTTTPRAMILDLVMPSVDGFGLMHRLNEMSLVRVPTVLTTGWNNADLEKCAASIGCAAVLCKPISLVELDAVVSSLIESGGAEQNPLSKSLIG